MTLSPGNDGELGLIFGKLVLAKHWNVIILFDCDPASEMLTMIMSLSVCREIPETKEISQYY